jgi:hypothetical protein
LPRGEHYPLPPREITEELPTGGIGKDTATLAYHFAYGGLTGAIFGAMYRRSTFASGIVYGAGVWAASYLGWIRALGILTWAIRHPVRRNALMLAAHAIWGASLAAGLTDLQKSVKSAFPRRAARLPDLQSERTR